MTVIHVVYCTDPDREEETSFSSPISSVHFEFVAASAVLLISAPVRQTNKVNGSHNDNFIRKVIVGGYDADLHIMAMDAGNAVIDLRPSGVDALNNTLRPLMSGRKNAKPAPTHC